MEFKIFGNKIEINIFKINEKKKEVKDNKGYNYNMIILLSTFLIFTLIFAYFKYKNNIVVGEVSKNDIIAYKKYEYKQDILDDELREKIYKNTKADYDRKTDVEQNQIKRFEKVLTQLDTIDIKDENAIYDFIKLNKLNISVSDIISIGINRGYRYNNYLLDVLTEVYAEGVIRKSDLNKILSKKQIVLDSYEKNLIKNFIEANLILNEEKTKSKIDENIQSLRNNTIVIKKGDVIVKKGETITNQEYNQLIKLGLINGADKLVRVVASVIFNISIAITIYITARNHLKKTVESKGFYPTYLLFVFVLSLYTIFAIDNDFMLFLTPITIIVINSLILTKDKFYSFLITMLVNILVSPNVEWFIITNLLTVIAINNIENIKTRMDIVKLAFKLGAIQAIFCLIYASIYNHDLKILTIMLAFSIISSFLTGVICLGTIPYFENTFNILTDIKLLEIGDYSAPLLKRLLLEAPGTFHHSILVGALAEQAAQEIGANPILARVGAYYHDIGKLKRPLYFIENQDGKENLHNELKPSLSSLILTSHTNDGYILAKNQYLPEEILKIIIEHHGTTSVQYFYYKAVEIGENINETDFRYVGPKPSSKESALVMLADTVEAAVRASKDKSKEGIENTIRYLIKYKIDDNQLSDCDISLNDIEKIVQAFLKVLRATYHERIQYPKIGRK